MVRIHPAPPTQLVSALSLPMKLLKLLIQKNVLKYGDFKLRSGIKSSYYCDIKEAIGDPHILKEIVKEMIKVVPKDATCIAASGYGGITITSLVAYKLNLPITLVRDKVKDHGTRKIIDGYMPNKNDVVCIVDDVFTTGSSVSDTKKKLLNTKAKFSKAVVVLNRSRRNDIISLITDKDIGK